MENGEANAVVWPAAVDVGARLEHDGSGWNQPDPSCPVEPRSPVRANGMRWNRTRFHLIPFRS